MIVISYKQLLGERSVIILQLLEELFTIMNTFTILILTSDLFFVFYKYLCKNVISFAYLKDSRFCCNNFTSLIDFKVYKKKVTDV